MLIILQFCYFLFSYMAEALHSHNTKTAPDLLRKKKNKKKTEVTKGQSRSLRLQLYLYKSPGPWRSLKVNDIGNIWHYRPLVCDGEIPWQRSQPRLHVRYSC